MGQTGARKEVTAFYRGDVSFPNLEMAAVSEAAGGGEAVLRPLVKAEGSTSSEQQSCFQQVSLSLLLQPLSCILFGKHNRCKRQGPGAPCFCSPTCLLMADAIL